LADFQADGVTSADHVFESWWWYRVNGVEPRETRFTWFPPTQTYVGNTATLSWTGLGGGRFSAQLLVLLTDGPSAGQTRLREEMTLTNTSAAAISIAVFKYVD